MFQLYWLPNLTRTEFANIQIAVLKALLWGGPDVVNWKNWSILGKLPPDMCT